MPSGRRSGFALPLVLLALLVLTGISHGALVFSRHHALVSRAEVRQLQARLVAEGAIRLHVSRAMPVAPLGSDDSPEESRTRVRVGPRTEAAVTVRRLGPEWLWIEGTGSIRGEPRADHPPVAGLYWSLDPGARVEAVRATVEVGGEVSVSAPSSVAGFSTAPAADPGYALETCSGEDDSLRGLAGGARPAIAPLTLEAGSVPSLGLLKPESAAYRASAPGAALPTESSTELVVTGESLTVPPDGLRGVIVVGGDLEVPSDRRLSGIALVGGSLRIRAGARFVGAARVVGSVTVDRDGRILGSPCTVFTVLRDLPDLSRPVPAPGGTWMTLP